MKVWMRATYSGRNNWDNHPKVVVRVSFDDASGYSMILEATDRLDYEYVKPRREEDGEDECQTITCALQYQGEQREDE